MSEVKIILLCGGKLAIPALRELAFFNVLAAVVIPKHCGEMIEEVDSILNKTTIPVLEVDEASYAEEIATAITEFEANVGLMITFSYLLPASVYTLPAKGFFNIHPGALPAYRGPDPVFRQIKNREKFAAVTMHKVETGFDTGAVVMEEKVLIEATDTHGIVTYKLSVAAARLTGVLIKLITFDLPVPGKMQDTAKAKYYRLQTAKDITVNWDKMDADAIIALINACNPWNKGAVTRIRDKIIRLLHAEKVEQHLLPATVKPGTIIKMNEKEFIISTLNNEAIAVHLISIDEGFLPPSYLSALGIKQGNTLNNFDEA